MLFKNLFNNILNEAEGDEEQEETQQEESEGETQEEETEEQDNQEDDGTTEEDQEFQDSEGGDSVLDDEDGEGSDDTEDSSDDEENQEEVKGNPHAKRVYFQRFEKLEDLIKRFQETIKDQEIYYKNDDKTEKRNKDLINYITVELNNSLDQISYLLEKGVINSLDIRATQNIYARMKTKLDQCIKLYSKVIKVKV